MVGLRGQQRTGWRRALEDIGGDLWLDSQATACVSVARLLRDVQRTPIIVNAKA